MSRPTSLHLELETLEAKRMMAGDVNVSVTGGGDLLVTGDQQDNQLVIESVGIGNYRLTGIDGTRINGQQSVTVTGVEDDVRIQLRNGDNRLHLDGVLVRDDLQILTGSGEDKIWIENGVVGDDLDIRTGRGDDTLLMQRALVNDRLNIRTDQGDDGVMFEQMRIQGRSRLNFGSGNDDLFVYRSDLDEGLTANLGSGDDAAYFDRTFGARQVTGAAGFDAVYTVGTSQQRSVEAVATAVASVLVQAPDYRQFDIDVDVTGPGGVAMVAAEVETGSMDMEMQPNSWGYGHSNDGRPFEGRAFGMTADTLVEYNA